MIREPLTMFCYADISGTVRGKGFPSHQLDKRLKSGVGWTPTNIMFTALGTIAPSPFGPFGDLILKPDPKAEANVDFGDGSPKEHFFLCDVLETDGSPWSCCPPTPGAWSSSSGRSPPPRRTGRASCPRFPGSAGR